MLKFLLAATRRSFPLGVYGGIARRYASDQGAVEYRRRVGCRAVRNIGIVAHVDAGKTTTCERMLYYSGEARFLGDADVDKGDTIMDYLALERERGITINTAVTSFNWSKEGKEPCRINVVDTPGHVDFTVEVERAVRVMDGVVTILDGVAGVQAQTETVWRQVDRYNIPSVMFINKLDREGASISTTLDSIRERLWRTVGVDGDGQISTARIEPLLVQYPLLDPDAAFVGGEFSVVDLVSMEKLEWMDETGKELRRTALTASMLGDMEDGNAIAEARATLLDSLTQHDEELFSKFMEVLEANEWQEAALLVDPSDVAAAVRRVCHSRLMVPVFVGSALKNRGVQCVLDAVVEYLPAPEERPPPEVMSMNGRKRVLDEQGQDAQAAVALAFKKMVNANVMREEKVSKLFRINADEMVPVDVLEKGDVCAVVGLKHTRTGDTLFSAPYARGSKGMQKHALKMAGIDVPQAVFMCAVESEASKDERALEQALQLLQMEDPSFYVTTHPDTGQTLMNGMGELHMEILFDRLINHYKVKAAMGKMHITYRTAIPTGFENTITDTFETEWEAVRIVAETRVHVCGRERGEGNSIEIVSGNEKSLLSLYENAARDGAEAALRTGHSYGFPVEDVEVTVKECSGEGMSESVLRMAVNQAVLRAIRKGDVTLLEPVMSVTLEVDEEFVGTVISDLTGQKRGMVLSTEADSTGRRYCVRAEVPLAEMIGYSTHVRSLTHGGASFHCSLERYGELPKLEQAKVVDALYGR